MKKQYLIFICIVLIILSLTGCKSAPEIKKVDGSVSVAVNAEGGKYNNGLSLEFNGENKDFILESPIVKATHDSSTCSDCGFVEHNGKKAFYICHNSKGHSGIMLKLPKPVKSSFFTGAAIEFMTSKDTKKAELKLLTSNEKSITNVANEKVLLSGGSSEWKKVNIAVSDFAVFANRDGYIESFQLFILNTDNVDVYISELTFKINSEALCNVDIDTSCFYERGAVDAIADKIKANFESINLSAQINIDCISYLQNTSKDNGEITYDAGVTMSNGKFFVHSDITKVIPALHNSWLENNDSFYGSTQDYSYDWEDDFTAAGNLKLSSHDISCLEGIKKVEYAIVSSDTDYKDDSIIWHDAQKLVLNKKGIKSLYINSYLDYGSELVNGNKYRMIVRGVSNNDNYIKHIDKSFTYKEYSTQKNAAIAVAFDKIKNITISGESNDISEDIVKDKIKEVINDSNVSVIVKKKFIAGSTTTFDISVTYADKSISDCSGDAFTLYDYKVWHYSKDMNSNITLNAPYDGQKDIIIASEYIYDLADATYKEFTSSDYGYINGEKCTPPAIKLEWADSSDTKEYKIFISENQDFSNAYEFTSKETTYDVYNLKVGTKYYWKVMAGDVVSPVFMFETKGGYPRFIKADGVCNMRDLGGYITKDGKIIKQGLLFRSAVLDKISSSAKNDLAYMLGIKTDIDLRGESHSKSPLGKDVQIFNEPLKWYQGIFDTEAEKITAKTVKYFADTNNYPIDFHCSLGRDRTGTLSIILLGLLGVDEETIFRDYHYSFFSEPGMFTVTEFNALQVNLSEFKKHIDSYGEENDTFNERIEAYMLHIGVTQEEINSIRSILLEDAPVVEEVENDKVIFDNSDDDHGLLFIIIIIAASVLVVGIAVTVLLIILKKRRKTELGDNT